MLAFIVCPTKNANIFSFPALYSATLSAFAAKISSIIANKAPSSETCLSPNLRIVASTSFEEFAIKSSKTSFAAFPEIVLSSILFTIVASVLHLLATLQ